MTDEMDTGRKGVRTFAVYGKVEGSIYLGEYEASSAEEALQMAENATDVCFCHQCASKCEDPQVSATSAEEVQP